MLTAKHRDRLIGAIFMGAIWTTLSAPIVCGFNPVGAFVQELGPAGAAFVLLIGMLWTALFYGILTIWSRKHER